MGCANTRRHKGNREGTSNLHGTNPGVVTDIEKARVQAFLGRAGDGDGDLTANPGNGVSHSSRQVRSNTRLDVRVDGARDGVHLLIHLKLHRFLGALEVVQNL